MIEMLHLLRESESQGCAGGVEGMEMLCFRLLYINPPDSLSQTLTQCCEWVTYLDVDMQHQIFLQKRKQDLVVCCSIRKCNPSTDPWYRGIKPF